MFPVRVAIVAVLCLFLSGLEPAFAAVTIGNQNIGSVQDTGDSSWMNGSKIITGSQSVTVTSMSVHVGPVDSAPNNQYELAIYSDNGDAPGARIAVSATGTLTGNAWNTLPISATLQSGSSYWLFYNANGRTGAVNNMQYDAGAMGAGAYSASGTSFGTWPASFGAATRNDAAFSLYISGDPVVPDSIFPTVALTAPAPNATVSGVVTVSADASDNVGVAGVQFQVDATSIGTEVTTPPYEVSWDSSQVSNATHSLTAIARDTSGNTTTSTAVVVTASNTNQESSIGSWSAVMNWPIVATQGSVLRTGKVLLWDQENTTTHPRVWDPATGTLTSTPAVPSELWCSGNITLANGKVWTAGGHWPNVGEVGISATYLYDPLVNTWTRTNDMAYPRWYPTLTPLSDGRVVILSGQISPDNFADVAEIYDPTTGGITTIPGVLTSELLEDEYPADFHLPNGKVLAISPQWGPVQLLDVATSSWTYVATTSITLGSAVQYRPGKILMSGGGSAFQAPSSTDAAVLDMNVGSPSWRPTTRMALGRYMHNLVMLPTGNVLAVGGADLAYQQTSTGPLPVEQWDPDTEQWTTLAPMQVPRYYHSVAMLLPDGRVLAAGGGHNETLVDRFSAQVYSPPYLFKGPRPTIASAPDAVPYGGMFTVNSPEALTIASVSLMDLASVTHAVTMNQLYRELPFSQTSGQLTITAPVNSDRVPPGYYMLFIVDANGVPSVAKILQIGSIAPPPPGTIGLTTIGGAVDVGDSNYLNGSLVTTTNGGQIASLSVYMSGVDSSSTFRQYQLAIYTNSNGRPGTLVATSAKGTLTAYAWNTLGVTATLQPNTKYWLIYNTNGRAMNVNNMSYDTAGSAQSVYSTNKVTFGTWPPTFPASTLIDAVFSLFATFAP